MTYPIPAQITEVTYEVKKSKFIACACPADNRESAMDHLARIKTLYPDARHHCWAYLLGNPQAPVSAAMSDDGEPSGTAGKPILNVLQHKDVGDIIIVVTRYFGGIKLGAGGLVRAYSSAAQQVMDALPREHHIELQPLTLVSSFKHEQFVHHFIAQHKGNIVSCEYRQDVHLEIALPKPVIDEFIASCNNLGIAIIPQ
jgi:uncharacterized YigZ family protein